MYLINLGNLGTAYYMAGRSEDAAATYRTILDLNPLYAEAYGGLGLALLEMGELEEALAAAESATSPLVRLGLSLLANYALGREPEFDRAFQELREEWGEVLPQYVALAYAYTGDVAAAFEWLDRVTPEQPRATWFSFVPLFDNLRDDPRWAAYRERMGQSEERLAAISFEVRLPR